MGFQQGISAMNAMGRIGTQKLPSKTSGMECHIQIIVYRIFRIKDRGRGEIFLFFLKM